MASDVLVNESQTGGGEFDIMTSATNGKEQVEVDLMAAEANGCANSDGSDRTQEEEDKVDEEEITPERVSPQKMAAMKQALGEAGNEDSGMLQNGDSNGHHCNGDTNGHHEEPENVEPSSQQLESVNNEVQVEEEEPQHPKHSETTVVSEETNTTPEGDTVVATTTTTVVVDEGAEGELQVVTTKIKTTKITTSELVVEGGSGQPVEPEELAVNDGKEPGDRPQSPAEKWAQESCDEPEHNKTSPTPKKEHKDSAARRLFNFVRSPKHKTVDDPNVVSNETKEEEHTEQSEEKVKSPHHQKRIFGWRKTWTPEKSKSEQKHDEKEGEKPAEESEEAKTEENTNPEGEKAATLPKKKNKKEEKEKTPKKKFHLGLMKKSKSTTASPSKPTESTSEKWASENCTEEEPTEKKEDKIAEEGVAIAENVEGEVQVENEVAVVESAPDAENKKEEAAAEEKEGEENDKKADASTSEKWAAEGCDEEENAHKTPVKNEKPEKKTKASPFRKSWTFRMSRSKTETDKIKSQDDSSAPVEKSATSPGKPFFSGFLHRNKKEVKVEEKVEEKVAEETEGTSKPVEEEVTAAPPSSVSMPHLTPEKKTEESTADKWAKEGCEEEEESNDHPVTSTAVKTTEQSPMRRSASLRMPSSLSRFFRFLGPRHRHTTVDGGLNEENTPTTPPNSQPPQVAPHTTSLTTPVSPRTRQQQEPPSTEGKDANTTPARHSGGFRFWSGWRSSGGSSTFGRFRRKDKNATLDDTSLIVNTSLTAAPPKSATLHDMPKDGTPSVDLGAILAKLPPHSPNDHSPTYIGISRVLNGYAEYNSPTRRSGASSVASQHKSPGGTAMVPTNDVNNLSVDVSNSNNNNGSLLQTVTSTSVCEVSSVRDADACLATVEAEQMRLENRSETAKKHLDNAELPAEARGQIEATIGKTNLLLTQKFKQFRDLCDESKKPGQEGQPPPPNHTDLAGFWDLVLIQVTDLDNSYDCIERMRLNNWQLQPVPAVNGDSKTNENGNSKKQKKKKAEKPKKKDEAAASAKSRFAEFKQRMFKGKQQQQEVNGAEPVNETNGTVDTVVATSAVVVTVEEAKS